MKKKQTKVTPTHDKCSEIISVDELKEYIGIEDNEFDQQLEQIVNATNCAVTTVTGRVFGKVVTVVDEVYDYKTTVFLDNIDIVNITEIKDKSDDVISDTSYHYNHLGRVVMSYWKGNINSKITYDYLKISYEYGELEVPADLHLATLKVGAHLFEHYGEAESRQVNSESVGSYSVSYYNKAEPLIIDRYSRIRL